MINSYGHMGKILIVDDNLDLLRTTKDLLEREGHEIVVAESEGEEFENPWAPQ